MTAGPGSIAHWPGGLVLAFPAPGTVAGTVVLAPGDLNLTFKRYLERPVTLTIVDDHITEIAGDGVDADLFRSYLAAFADAEGDRAAYACSHVGWGLNHQARWDELELYDKRDMNGTEARAFAGGFLYSTGANEVAGRFTAGPLRPPHAALHDHPRRRGGGARRRAGGRSRSADVVRYRTIWPSARATIAPTGANDRGRGSGVPEAAEIARVFYSDLHGLSHGKYVAGDDLAHPTHYAVTVLTQTLDGDMPPAPGYGADVGFPDMEARADLATRRPGWEPDTDVVFADLFHTDGRELPIDVRRALRLTADRWVQRGLTPMAGFEMELYLLAKDPSEGFEALGVPWHRVYGTGPSFDPTGLGREIFETCRRCGIPVEGVNGEFHPAQMEVALRYRDAVTAADDAFLFRELARELAHRAGRGATFMPRPFPDLVGSGLHVNLSLQDAQGSNALAAAEEEHGLSALGRHALAGLIAHHEALCAIGAPTVNSYKRLRPGPDRRLLGQLGPGQPLQHLPHPRRAGPGHPHRVPQPRRHGQPPPDHGRAARGHAPRRRGGAPAARAAGR